MSQFHEGQEVEIYELGNAIHSVDSRNWRKAKIVRHSWDHPGYRWEVQFPDGTRAALDAEHIMEAKEPEPVIDANPSPFSPAIEAKFAEINAMIRLLRASHDRLHDALGGLIGLLQLLENRDDVSPDLRETVRNSHRLGEALAAFAETMS